MKNILILGGTGTIGQHLVDMLKQEPDCRVIK